MVLQLHSDTVQISSFAWRLVLIWKVSVNCTSSPEFDYPQADCVFPTRTARFGVALTHNGPLNLSMTPSPSFRLAADGPFLPRTQQTCQRLFSNRRELSLPHLLIEDVAGIAQPHHHTRNVCRSWYATPYSLNSA